MSYSVRHLLFRLFPDRRWTLFVPTFSWRGISLAYPIPGPKHSATGCVMLTWVWPWIRKKYPRFNCRWFTGTMGINREKFNTLKEVRQYWGPEYDAAMKAMHLNGEYRK